ncbi:hypothetical protein PVV74_17305 [Roseovarius sp. SK2]|uniref:hypothetical protein n=1 Tax=Roseovarius TaxID=74030 RepID=UPI00237BB023|nr:hypothetical protein [Roseovarius sp. SK2]MDD9727221.1 hypothetical protein [Roseovarius sp. SK2]
MTWVDIAEASDSWAEADTEGTFLEDESGNLLLDESGNALEGPRVLFWAAQSEASDSWVSV